MRIIEAKAGSIAVGHVGDNEWVQVKFDISSILRDCGEGHHWMINVKRSCDPDAYPVQSQYIEQDGTDLLWTVTSADLWSGYGAVQLLYFADDGRKLHSAVYGTNCKKSLGSSATPPDPWQGYVDSVSENAQKAENAVEHYPYIDDITKNWMVWDADTESFVDTGVHAEGSGGGSGGASTWTDIIGKPFNVLGETLIVNNGVLDVNTADTVEEDNTLPITSAAVHTEIGNIEVLLSAI